MCSIDHYVLPTVLGDLKMIRKYGRDWYETKKEAESACKQKDRIYYDEGMKCYYLREKRRKSFWVI